MPSRTCLRLLLIGAAAAALAGCGSGTATTTVTVAGGTTGTEPPADTQPGGGRRAVDRPPDGESDGTRSSNGQPDGGERASDPAANAAIARRALLRPSDLPAGWSPDAPDDTPLGCHAFDAMLQRPRGISPTFRYGDSASIAEVVNVVSTTADADDALDAMLAHGSIDCLSARSAQSVRARGAEVRDIDITPLADAPVGDRSMSMRVKVLAAAGGTQESVYEDFVFLRADRGFAIVALLTEVTAPGDQLRAALAERAAQRLSAALQRD